MISETPQASEPSPAQGPSWVGCLIPIAALMVLLGLGTCTAVTGWLQNRAIAEFTEAEPRFFGRQFVPLDAAAGKVLEGKFSALQAAAKEKRRVEVSFSVPELNQMLRSQVLLESLRDSTRVLRIGRTGMEVESSQAVRKLGGGVRYLNGVFVFRPVISGTNAWQLELDHLRVPGKEVPAGFVDMARELHLFRFDLGAKALQEVLRETERMELEEGRVLVVTRGPAQPPQSR